MQRRPVIFLSASVPLADRHPKYFQTADVIGIREAVRALVHTVIPKGVIVFGGHPAITPLVRLYAQGLGVKVGDHFFLYQSAFFNLSYPPDNNAFEKLVEVPAVAGDIRASIGDMREQMLGDFSFSAGVFIGGMEGVEDEFTLFRMKHPNAVTLPVASTGAAAKIVFGREGPFPADLETELDYAALFSRHLPL